MPDTKLLAGGGQSAAIGTTAVEAATARYQLPIAEFLNIAIQLAKALVFLHQNQIIHKDIKPDNIIINPATMQVKLADFSIASRLNKETPNLKNPDRLEGTLAYMSPEQTGRMNRGVDYRSDFYSLGVTFYELLTGKLPFRSNDPLELVHCHIAKQPISIQQLNPQIPPVLAEIVEKLMAKNAENRYQSAAGLLADLERCQNQILIEGTISNLIPGQLDAMSQLLIPQKNYGREAQIEQLLQTFDRVSKGSGEIVSVGGYSGIGKSALVHEIMRNLTRQRGYLVSGKFDQFKRNVPYTCFNQAMRSLVQQILSESQAQIELWREKLLQALAANAKIAIEAIPELELILGPQPDVPELGAIESQNRFNRVMQQLIQAIASAEHPLVIFLDDCQWIDAATVNLYQQNCLQKIPYLLLIVAYRDNEVSPTHPFMLANEAIRAGGIPMTAITLAPLAIDCATQLIAETLRCAAETATPLAKLLVQKTDGNPFFMKQMLRYFHQEGFLKFNLQAAEWQWDIKHIERQEISANVVELMVRKIKTLSTATQRILQIAACIDNQFSLDMLSVASEQSWTKTAQDLWEALQGGLILPVGDAYRIPQVFELEELEKLGKMPGQVCYKFMHDRVQQAAYAMIPDAQKERVHLTIGRLLLLLSSQAQRQERIFDIVNHFNFARGLICELSQLYELAQLNLQAGKTAKAASAFETALSFFQSGCNCLPTQSWEDNYQLTWALHFEWGEAEYLNGKNDEALAIIDLILPQTRTLLERCRVNELKMTCLRMKNDLPAAYRLGIETLQLLGIEFEAYPDDGYLLRELAKTKEMIGDRLLADLADLPTLTDPLQLAAHRILKELDPIAFFTSPNAKFLCGIKLVQLTIEYGNSRISALGYVSYALALIAKYREIEVGCEAGELSIHLYERWDLSELGACILHIWADLMHHNKCIDECKFVMLKALNNGLETGAYQYSGYAAANYLASSFFGNESLQTSADIIDKFIPILEKIDRNMLAYFLLNKQVIYQLTCPAETAKNPPTFIDEAQLLKVAESSGYLSICFVVYLYKLTVANWFGEVDRALEYANTGVEFFAGAAGGFLGVVFRLVAGVAHEVNNPVSFISGNLHHATDYISDLISLVQVYQDNFPEPGQQVLDEIEAIELEYLVEDLPKMIESMKLGTDRIRDIMQSLRNYSRTDGIEKKSANIHEGIDTTLMILSHRLKASANRPTIKVIKNYGELPNIECYPGQLNQVFMNLLANAIDALEESNFGKTYKQIESNPNVITISTSVANSSETVTNSTVKIRIVDNGIGMPEHIKDQLFLPFFTTKAEGKGTGLGLPICHDIVTKKHGGSLECFSAPGRGTEFAIAIPVRSSSNNND